MNITDLPTLYTEAQAADYLGVSEATLARWRRAGKLTHTRSGSKPRYTSAHLDAYLKAQEQCGSTSSNEKTTSGTSAGPSQMDAQAAHQLAREIAKKRNAS